MPRDDAHRRGRSVEVKPLHSRHSSYPNSMSASHKAFKAVVIPRMSSRQWIALGLGAFFALILLSQAIGPKSSPWRISDEAFTFPSQGVVARPNEDVSLDLSQVLVGPPTKHFRDNLRNETRYLTSWLSAGFTNDVMTLGNLIYLAMITNRIPILPPVDSYIGKRPNPMPFSAIFDLPRLRRALNIPVLEWQEVKDPRSEETDILGCWNIFEVDDMRASGPRESRNPISLVLDISYTRAPTSVKLIPGFIHDAHSSFWALAPLAFPDMRAKALASPEVVTTPGVRTGTSTPPDEQLLCFDYLFYVSADVPFEYDRDVYPSWHAVQRHFRWTSEVEKLGGEYLRRVLNVTEHDPIPLHITIHARHGDFKNWCNELDPQDCFAPLSVFAVRIAEIQKELLERKGVHVEHVIVTSDEEDEKWWDKVKAMGWLRIDHAKERTAETHGEWYPVILDAYVQSAGLGFVGTDRSTFSTVARRRVQDWHDGAVRTVRWGRPDADTH